MQGCHGDWISIPIHTLRETHGTPHRIPIGYQSQNRRTLYLNFNAYFYVSHCILSVCILQYCVMYVSEVNFYMYELNDDNNELYYIVNFY